jgi:protein phosphatase PTC1
VVRRSLPRGTSFTHLVFLRLVSDDGIVGSLFFLQHLLKHLESAPKDKPVPDILNETFLSVDKELSSLAEVEKTHSGCTAAVAFLRIEEGSDAHPPTSSAEEVVADEDDEMDGQEKGGKMSKVKDVLGKITGSSSSSSSSTDPTLQKTGSGLLNAFRSSSGSDGKPVTRPSTAKRVLYTANAGDARAVICRRGKAVRLTYDHKGSDQQEAKRITDAGGFVMNNRVNGAFPPLLDSVDAPREIEPSSSSFFSVRCPRCHSCAW